MATIKERAHKSWDEYIYPDVPTTKLYRSVYTDGYTNGATEQRLIDEREFSVKDENGNRVGPETLKNACEIVRSTTKHDVMAKVCDWLLESEQVPFHVITELIEAMKK